MSADRYVGAVDMSDWCARHAIMNSTRLYWQPMELTQNRSDVVSTPCVGEQTSSSILHRLHLPQQVLRHTVQQQIATVQVPCDKCLNDGLGCQMV